jgi:DNA-binding NarL/FixJ family response regulator
VVEKNFVTNEPSRSPVSRPTLPSVSCDAFSFGSIMLAGVSRPQLLMISQAWANLDLRPPLVVTSDWDPIATLNRLDDPAIVIIGQDYRSEMVKEAWNIHQQRRSQRVLIYIGLRDRTIDEYMDQFDHILSPNCSILEIVRVLSSGLMTLVSNHCESIANSADRLILASACENKVSEIREEGRRIVTQVSVALQDGEKDNSREAAETFADHREEFGTRAAKLTGRQLDVLKLLARGATNKEIGRNLEVSPHTVGAHIGAILRTLNVTNRMKAVAVAEELGLLVD